MINKRKIINDPVHGFISIASDFYFDIILHPWFQRLRRIQQLGMSSLVYPGATHSRFSHTLGAYFLMQQAIETLRGKGHEITDEEAEAATIAILLHDIGHGPYSHALEFSIVENINHEKISMLFMKRLNEQFNGRLSLAIEIFQNTYKKKFLHQLVSSQLDVDRLDYLSRDSFFTGVLEGIVGTERIIKMLNVHNDELVVDEKGIYSIEKFIVSRRLMYWQVYLHKTVLSAESMMIACLKRAKELSLKGVKTNATPCLDFFLSNVFTEKDFEQNPELLERFSLLDDSDIQVSLKHWMCHEDRILSGLSKALVNRNLFRIELQNEDFSEKYVQNIKAELKAKMQLTDEELAYFVILQDVSNNAYNIQRETINILLKNGEVRDISMASDQLDVHFLSKQTTKKVLCYPKI